MAAALVVSGCGGGRTTVASPSRTGPLVATREPTPVPPPSQASFAFLADLKSSNEVPPITDAEASCTGQGRFVLRAKLDPSGKITAANAQFSFFVNSCPNSTRIILAHIHQAPAGQNGAVKIDSGLKASQPIAVSYGDMSFNIEDVAVSDVALVADLIANPARYYLNIHSVSHTDGLVRGQLKHEN